MVILRDEQRIARMRRISQYMSFIGMAALLVGLVLVFTNAENVFLYQLIALAVGWLFSQVGIYLAHRYLRRPRPDEVLDEALKKVDRDGRLYHYLLPAPHVLLLPTGIIVLLPKWQGGNVTVEGDKWKQTGLGLRKFFGQEQLGNPTREAETMVEALASYIRKHAPEVEEVPIAALIVFTSKGNWQLDLKRSRIPAMHYTKIKGYLRQKKRPEPIPKEDYEAIRTAFDKKVTHLTETEYADSA
ncbi:MAG TPA: hypothetical protein VF177_16535 [Anaerolineae bacterium]